MASQTDQVQFIDKPNRPIEAMRPTTTKWTLRKCPWPGSSVRDAVISESPFRIGRASANDLSLANPTVSSQHAELLFVAEDLFVKDLNSTNGTFVNGRRIQHVEGLENGDLIQFGTEKFTVMVVNEAGPNVTISADVAGQAVGHLQFDRLLNEPAVIPFFQPIVQLVDRACIGYEILARSKLEGLETPFDMFQIAAERGMENELSVLMRREGVRIGQVFGGETRLYVNTHPNEVEDAALFQSLEDLRRDYPTAPIVLEIHESAVTSTDYLHELRNRLRDLNIELAYDDFGAGQARLLELADVPPEIIKFDMCLVQGLGPKLDERRQLVGSLVDIVRKLGVRPLAEGVETEEEAAACLELGFELAQGYLFGRPAPVGHWLD